jgi:hypothetical protein
VEFAQREKSTPAFTEQFCAVKVNDIEDSNTAPSTSGLAVIICLANFLLIVFDSNNKSIFIIVMKEFMDKIYSAQIR